MEFFKICFLHSSPTQTTGGRDHSDIIKLFLEQFVNILKAVIVKIMHSSPLTSRHLCPVLAFFTV